MEKETKGLEVKNAEGKAEGTEKLEKMEKPEGKAEIKTEEKKKTKVAPKKIADKMVAPKKKESIHEKKFQVVSQIKSDLPVYLL